MKIKRFEKNNLISYVTLQLEKFFPDEQQNLPLVIERNMHETLIRLERLINEIKMWPIGEFDYLHSTQYAIFLYFLANTIWQNEQDLQTCTKLFYLNKALNGIDLFYEIEMPDIFFIGHSVGIVLAKATYKNYLVLYQNSTVGKNHGIAPVFEEGVVMYPNTAVIGQSYICENTVISQGSSVINKKTSGNCIVYQNGPVLVEKPLTRNILADIFRI